MACHVPAGRASKSDHGGLSITTAPVLIPLVPKAIRLPTRKDLKDANAALAKQNAERESAEAEVRKLNGELERRVERRTAALKRSNEELAQFAYVASHDLKEPLRMVAIYTQLLKTRYQGKLDADADEYIKFAANGAQRMQALVEDLLSLAQADHAEPRWTLIPADAALDLALGALRMPIGETGARIARQPLPEVMGNPDQLALVFQNLIGNSLKYRSDKTPEIAIGVVEQAKEWQLSVRDNGIGFDPAYAERIFGVFKRLHANPEYPERESGYRSRERLSCRWGGRIWAISQAGAGDTFYFTIPKAAGLGALSPREMNEFSGSSG